MVFAIYHELGIRLSIASKAGAPGDAPYENTLSAHRGSQMEKWPDYLEGLGLVVSYRQELWFFPSYFFSFQKPIF